MDRNDLIYIEEALSVSLPDVFKDFILPYSNDRSIGFVAQGATAVPLNPELFVINQLQHFIGFINPQINYNNQQELESYRFVLIGDDGCGNYYFMRGDQRNSNELWLWEHDPNIGFNLVQKQTLKEYLSSCKVLPGNDPLTVNEGKGKTITRADHPHRSVLAPIPPDEWFDLIELNSKLELNEYSEILNPFTKERLSVKSCPGRALILDSEDEACFLYSYCSIVYYSESNPNARIKELINEMATALDANVF